MLEKISRLTRIDETTRIDVDRFWSNVAIAGPNDCWEWKKYRKPSGYGWRSNNAGNSKWAFTHRLAYFLHYKVDPGELCVLHKCDKPPCCNPNHLFLGDRDANNKDRMRKGRGNRWLKHPHPNKKVDSAIADEIRSRCHRGEKQRLVALDLKLSISSVNRAVRGVI